MSKVIGIDLGTTNSCVAVMEGGEAVVIPNAEGNRTTPSVVAFSKTGERMVGQVAKRQAITNPERTISSIKREMGTDHRVTIDGKSYTPQEISAMILQKLKADAEAYLGTTVTEAVITVPAYFTDSQRQATKDAGKIAGLDVKRIINEPTAAALAYGVDKEQAQKIMVYDLGGGTFDVSILEIDDGVIEVLATAGNNRLGGDDFDQCIMKYLVSEFKKSDGIDLSGDKVAMQRLKEAAEKAKIELSGVTTSNINLPYITADATGPKHLDVTLTRAKFNELTGHLVEATMGPVRQAMSDAGLKPSDLAKVLMVGGSSRIPAVVEAVKSFTGSEPFKGINPDECVAMGAALQAGVLTGDVKGLLLLDVTPLSLGIETMGGVCTRLIERNTTIPVKKSQIFSTAADNQTSVEVNVLQGEREMAAANKSLGRFHLDGIAPARRGVPQIEVTFDIDANGIVNVSAKDLGTGNAQHITITSSSNMSKEDIEKAVKEAEQYAAEDAKIKEKVEVRNQADQMVYQSEKTLGEVGDKIPADEKSKVQAGIDKLKETLKGDDTDAIKAATEELTQLFYAMSEKLYQQANPQGAQGAGPDMGGAQGGAQTGNTEKGLNSTDAKAVVAFYNKAVKASVKNPPKGKQTMKLEKLEGTGGLGKILGSFEGIAKKALEKNSTDTNYIPAGDHGDVLPTDVKNAKATNDGKYTTVSFDVNPQTDGPKESSSKGPVGRSIGTLGNVQNALDQLPGVSVTSGIENIKLTYDHAYVTVKIDNNTGKIVSGTWHYKVNVNVNNLGVKVIGIPASIDTLHGIVDYTVKIG